MFDIYLTGEIVPDVESDVSAAYGKIQIGQFSETFIASFVFWQPEQYENHWREGVERIVAGFERSALVVSYAEPSGAEFLLWWALYRDGDRVHFQNQILFFDRLGVRWRRDDLWASIAERQTESRNGLAISEWTVDLQHLRSWLDRSS